MPWPPSRRKSGSTCVKCPVMSPLSLTATPSVYPSSEKLAHRHSSVPSAVRHMDGPSVT